jgi:hypothetical protein
MSALHGLGRVGSGGAYRGPLDAGADADDAIPTRHPNTPLTNPLPHNAPNEISRDQPGRNEAQQQRDCNARARSERDRGEERGKEACEPYRSRRGGMREAAAGGGAAEAIGVFVTEPFLPSLSLRLRPGLSRRRRLKGRKKKRKRGSGGAEEGREDNLTSRQCCV